MSKCDPQGIHHCKTCTNSNDQCTSCIDGFYNSNFQCISCGIENHCKECTNVGICSSCLDGYQLNEDQKTCSKKKDNCRTMEGEECKECEDGFCLKMAIV